MKDMKPFIFIFVFIVRGLIAFSFSFSFSLLPMWRSLRAPLSFSFFSRCHFVFIFIFVFVLKSSFSFSFCCWLWLWLAHRPDAPRANARNPSTPGPSGVGPRALHLAAERRQELPFGRAGSRARGARGLRTAWTCRRPLSCRVEVTACCGCWRRRGCGERAGGACLTAVASTRPLGC